MPPPLVSGLGVKVPLDLVPASVVAPEYPAVSSSAVSAFKVSASCACTLVPIAKPNAVRASLADVDPVPPFATGSAPLTADASGTWPYAGSVPSEIRTRFAAPAPRRAVALLEFRTMMSPRVVIGSLRLPASPVRVKAK